MACNYRIGAKYCSFVWQCSNVNFLEVLLSLFGLFDLLRVHCELGQWCGSSYSSSVSCVDSCDTVGFQHHKIQSTLNYWM